MCVEPYCHQKRGVVGGPDPAIPHFLPLNPDPAHIPPNPAIPPKKFVDPDFHNAFIIPIYLMKEMFGWTDEVPHDENEGNEGHFFTYEISHSDSFHLNPLLDDLFNQWPVTIEYI